MKIILNKPDVFGVFASGLCLIHCLFTPVLFMVHAITINKGGSVPIWWQSIDYFFLTISFIAIYYSTRTTTKQFMKPAFWLCWLGLFLIVLNEKFIWMPLPEYFIYIPAIGLVGLHLYNLNYCQCKSDKCCVKNE